MILNNEILPDLNKPRHVNAFSNYGQFHALVFFDPGYSFSSSANALNSSTWLTGLEDGDIIILHDIHKVSPEHEEPLYERSQQDFEYKKSDGRYKWIISFDYDVQIYEKVRQLTGQDLKVCFFDGENILLKENTDGTYEGFETAYIDVRKIQIGQSTTKQHTVVSVELYETKEVDQLKALEPTFDFRSLERVEVQLYSISQNGTTVTLTVKDPVYGSFIRYLSASDFTISDDGGAITISSISEGAPGVYTLELDSALTTGNIEIDSDHYYTSTAQDYNETDTLGVTFTNVVLNSLTELEFDLHETISGNPVTSVSGWTVTDIDNGVISVSNAVHNGSGNWTLTLASNTGASGGTVAVDDSGLTGSSSYDAFEEEITYVLIQDVETNGRREITFRVNNVDTGLPVFGLTQFQIDSGSVTIDSVSSVSNYYTLSLSSDLSDSGVVAVTESGYEGSGGYTYEKLQYNILSVVAYTVTNGVLAGAPEHCIVFLLNDNDGNAVSSISSSDITITDTSIGEATITSVDSSSFGIIVGLGSAELLTGSIAFDNDDAEASRDYGTGSDGSWNNFIIRDYFERTYVIGAPYDAPLSFKNANIISSNINDADKFDTRGNRGSKQLVLKAETGESMEFTLDYINSLVAGNQYRFELKVDFVNGSGSFTMKDDGAPGTFRTITASTSPATIQNDVTMQGTDIRYKITGPFEIWIFSILIRQL